MTSTSYVLRVRQKHRTRETVTDRVCFGRDSERDLCLTSVSVTFVLYVCTSMVCVCDIIYNLCVIDLAPAQTSDSIIPIHTHIERHTIILHHEMTVRDHEPPTHLKFIVFSSQCLSAGFHFSLFVFSLSFCHTPAFRLLCVCVNDWERCFAPQSRCKRPSASLLLEFTDPRPAENAWVSGCVLVCYRVYTSGEMNEERHERR